MSAGCTRFDLAGVGDVQDLIYLALGAALFAVFGVYAHALRRL